MFTQSLSQASLPEQLRPRRQFRALLPLLLALSSGFSLPAQAPAPTPAPTATPDPTQTAPAATTPATTPAPALPPAPASASTPAPTPQTGEVTEEELKRQLIGKQLFLRGGYLGDNLSFNEHGEPVGHPIAGSYTLSGVEIEKVRLSKHKVELIGSRYALHFLGALPSEDPSKAVDRVKITPKKKILRITIDREQVIKPKKEKESPKEKAKGKPSHPAVTPTAPGTTPVASSETDTATATAPEKPAEPSVQQPAAPTAETAPEPAAEQAADPTSVTTTISPAHAAGVLRDALDKIFAPGLDEKLLAKLPDFWQLYYQAQAAGVDYRPKDPSVLRSNAVDQQAKVTTSIAPDSNEFAQASGIAGRALYRAVIGTDGKPGEIAVVRPIGFGLDENAVAAIRKASFQPALKAGQPVAETLDLTVLFRIYSKRTSVAATGSQTGEPTRSDEPKKPGPYSVNQPPPQPQQ